MRLRVIAGWASIAGLALCIAGCGGTPVYPNLPAIVTQPADQTITVGSSATFSVTATGQAPLTYQWYVFAKAIAGATSATYTTPAAAASDNGSFYFVVVSNSIGSTESSEATMTVNTPPFITSAAKTTLLEGIAGGFVVTTSGVPVASLSESGSLPTGVTFVDNKNGTATIGGTPTVVGTFPITITAQNTISPNATQSFVLTTATKAPAITSPGSVTYTQGNSGTYTITTTGAPIPSITETGTLPSGFTFVDNKDGTATLTGTPTTTGTTTFLITAQNGVLPNAVQTFMLIVIASSTSSVLRPESVLTFHDDAARTGQDLNETILTPTNVNSSTFGKIGDLPVDGAVDAQPLYLSNLAIAGKGTLNVLYVATENDSVYAFDAASGTVLWHDNLAAPGETAADNSTCSQSSPELGISATPVMNPASGPNGTIYVVATSQDSSGKFYQRLHALDAATGSELSGGPALIQTSAPATTSSVAISGSVFDPSQVQAQAGLLLVNGQVYASFAPRCASATSSASAAATGWVVGFDGSTLAASGAVPLAPNGGQNDVSLSGAGLSSDAAGNIYIFSGAASLTGTLNASSSGQAPFSNAFLKLSTSTAMAVTGFSSVSNSSSAFASDAAPSLTGALILPDLTDASGVVWHLAVGAGADGNIYVVNRDTLNGVSLQASALHQEIPGVLSLNGANSIPSYFGNTVYFGSANDALKAFGINGAMLTSSPVSQTINVFGSAGATPSISANLTTGAILWAVDTSGPSPVLRAYDATNLTQELYNSAQASSGRDNLSTAGNFVFPVIANGKVYVATKNGVAVFGLLQ